MVHSTVVQQTPKLREINLLMGVLRILNSLHGCSNYEICNVLLSYCIDKGTVTVEVCGLFGIGF